MDTFSYDYLFEFIKRNDMYWETNIGNFSKFSFDQYQVVSFHNCKNQVLDMWDSENTIAAIEYNGKILLNNKIYESPRCVFPNNVLTCQELTKNLITKAYVQNDDILVSDHLTELHTKSGSFIEELIMIELDIISILDSLSSLTFENVLISLIYQKKLCYIPNLLMSDLACGLKNPDALLDRIRNELKNHLKENTPPIKMMGMSKQATIVKNFLQKIKPLQIYSQEAAHIRDMIIKSRPLYISSFQVNYLNSKNEVKSISMDSKYAVYLFRDTERFYMGPSKPCKDDCEIPDGCLRIANRLVVPYNRIQTLSYRRRVFLDLTKKE